MSLLYDRHTLIKAKNLSVLVYYDFCLLLEVVGRISFKKGLRWWLSMINYSALCCCD